MWFAACLLVYAYIVLCPGSGEWLKAAIMFFSQTPVEEVPAAIAPFQGRVLIGVGKLLRVYDLGKKKLLRKCENKVNVLLWGRFTAPVLKIVLRVSRKGSR